MRRLIVIVLLLAAIAVAIFFFLADDKEPLAQPPAGEQAVEVDSGPVLNPPANAGEGDSDRVGR